METGTKERASSSRPWRWGHLVLLVLVAVGWLVISGLNLWMGELNQDEGWYLYAAKQMTEGRLPYRDFAFTQAPMLPLLYSAAYGWIERYGLLGGRLLTWAFGILGMLSAVWLAMRSGPRRAQRLTGGICLILIALNVSQSYFTTVVKTYSLAAMFLCTGLTALSFVNRTRAFRPAFLSGLLLACAASTRISFGLALAVGGLYLIVCRQRLKAWAWLDYALGGALGLAATLLPFWVLGEAGFRFGVLDYHSLREAGSLGMRLAYKVGCLSRLSQAYLPAATGGLVLLGMAGVHLARRGAPMEGTPALPADSSRADLPPGFTPFLWVVVLLLGLLHLAAPFPYDDYFTPIYPVYCAALAATGVRWWRRVEKRRFAACSAPSQSARRLALLTAIGMVCALHAFASPLARGWFIAGRDRIWWRLREQSPIAQLRDAAQWARDLTLAEGGTLLLTQDIYLAVEAGLPVPRGMEMGPFSYYPDWTLERSEELHVLNRDMLMELLSTETNAPIAALSGYSFAIQSPNVTPVSREDQVALNAILQERFDHVESISSFGQAGTTLEFWRLKKVLEPVTSGGDENSE
ncbi:MAG: hypothetical protein LBN38_08005 [Verrucomicrobiota bacterium]|nr:hypothetical protein [Verrucomicrobiota bacterium]